jgi:hypothetical protein
MDQMILNRHAHLNLFFVEKSFNNRNKKSNKSNKRFADFALYFIDYFKFDVRYVELCGII